jgi:hypothetical protein
VCVPQTLEQLKAEFLRDRVAYCELVGTLYPSIIYQRLFMLRAAYMAAGGSELDLPFVPAPQQDGRAPYFQP